MDGLQKGQKSKFVVIISMFAKREVPVENAIDLLDDSDEDEKSTHDVGNSVKEGLSRGKHNESYQDGSDNRFNREEFEDKVKSFF